MPYRTGTGIYSDMMADILAHAIADGWTEVGGLGTGWPIESPGTGFWVDWANDTFVAADFTTGAGGGSKTFRRLRYGISTVSGADASSNAPIAPSVSLSAEGTINSWHIFSDPTVSDYVHCTWEISNGIDPQVWGHISFGMLDQESMTHGGAGFCGGQIGRPYAVNSGGVGDWNSLGDQLWAWGGSYGEQDDGSSQLTTIIKGTNHPIPGTPGAGGWPPVDTRLLTGSYILHMNRPSFRSPTNINNGAGTQSLNWAAMHAQPPPFSGAVSMMPMPIFYMNGASSSSVMFYAGSIPNVRMCSMEGYAPGDEVTFAGDTWKLFPVLCLKGNNTLGSGGTVTSGQAGYAYKKVA